MAADAPVLSCEAPSRATGVAGTKGKRVLYIDDDDAMVFLASRILEQLGYRVSGFIDPHRALAEFHATPGAFDVAVTDLSMPGMSGFQVAHALHQIRSDLPILMTSGYVRPEDRDTARARGIVDLILKPNSAEELGHALDRIFSALAS